MQQFDFSGKGVEKRQRLFLIFSLAGTPFIFLLILLTTNVRISILIIACVFTDILLLLILKIQTSSMNKSMRAMKVCIDNDKITKKFDKGEQSLAWTDIVNVKLIKNSKGVYINVIICGKDKKIIYLFDFDRMHEIVDLIREKVSRDVNITTKQNKIDPDNPVLFVLVGATTLVLIALVRQGGQHVEDVFDTLIFLVIGSSMLIFKPLSKTNLRFKRYEKFLSWGLILIAILMLIEMLINK
jgi:hypothetical protein